MAPSKTSKAVAVTSKDVAPAIDPEQVRIYTPIRH